MELFLILIVLFFVIGIVFSIAETKNKAEKLKQYKTRGYNFENKLSINLYAFAVDKNKEKLLIIKPYSTTPINQKQEQLLDFKDIIGHEISNNGETVTKASLGAPIVGGLILGAGGVLLGSILGNRTTKDKVNVDLIIQLNSFETPLLKIPIVTNSDLEINKKHNLNELEKLCVWFKLILQKNENLTDKSVL